jgi:hypothetical protein
MALLQKYTESHVNWGAYKTPDIMSILATGDANNFNPDTKYNAK